MNLEMDRPLRTARWIAWLTSPRLPFVLILLLLSCVLLVAFAFWQRNHFVHLSHQLATRTSERDALLQERRQLQINVERLDALDRIEDIAMQQLQMRPAAPHQRIIVPLQSHAKVMQERALP